MHVIFYSSLVVVDLLCCSLFLYKLLPYVKPYFLRGIPTKVLLREYPRGDAFQMLFIDVLKEDIDPDFLNRVLVSEVGHIKNVVYVGPSKREGNVFASLDVRMNHRSQMGEVEKDLALVLQKVFNAKFKVVYQPLSFPEYA